MELGWRTWRLFEESRLNRNNSYAFHLPRSNLALVFGRDCGLGTTILVLGCDVEAKRSCLLQHAEGIQAVYDKLEIC